MKNILYIVLVLILIAGGVFFYSKPQSDKETSIIKHEDTGKEIRTKTFSGKLEDVNTGCFSDGECYVVVDGKHITLVSGWSREVVGSIENYEVLEKNLGKEIEVYARDSGDGTYTLYGSKSFYIRFK